MAKYVYVVTLSLGNERATFDKFRRSDEYLYDLGQVQLPSNEPMYKEKEIGTMCALFVRKPFTLSNPDGSMIDVLG